MPAKTDFHALPWGESLIDQNGRQRQSRSIEDFCLAGDAASAATASPMERWEQMRNDIRRGHEYLEQVRRELAESRAALEQWPTFEFHCGKSPLAQLTETVVVRERIEKFLISWLQRRENQLDHLSTALAIGAATPHAPGPCRADKVTS